MLYEVKREENDISRDDVNVANSSYAAAYEPQILMHSSSGSDTRSAEPNISSLVDPEEEPLPNCYFLDPDKVIKLLSYGSHDLKHLKPSDVNRLLRRISKGHKVLVSGSWLTRAFRSNLDFNQQDEVYRKFLLVRDGLRELDDCDRGWSKEANAENSKKSKTFVTRRSHEMSSFQEEPSDLNADESERSSSRVHDETGISCVVCRFVAVPQQSIRIKSSVANFSDGQQLVAADLGLIALSGDR
ncbi:unnamed protein product [Strongylus vulgaris]|uniref:Uncharacterized protein n=1 Tax=Strongylus vulgaris TaxID=40348 RepID=A0A3P7J7H4_STRVU|nr:unnamed protein product [Strongylus vulgaris]